ncbi:extracellular solute-binding protein [Paenibacillus sepulcri]|uniref:ABC transporter substrate-binding protein n=1 Tax=Paenibacillus sepulcri TaxID=359917 RepID=A0ABS7BXH9_9BACL|nr:ABC transporter substrate-binding protein [Paenibacillus sepulcri]
MKSFKGKSSLIPAFLMLALVLAGCSGNAETPANTAISASSQANNTASEGKADLSEHVTLKMVMLGDADPDMQLVDDEINKLLERDLNASIEVEIISLSDYQQRYPLIFATGEPVDLIYTGDWALYDQEASKGAFAEVTEDILKTYMPMTWEAQDPASFDQAKIDGKAYFVPISLTPFPSAQGVLIRGDLREKYNLPEIKTVDDLEAYYNAVAENEDGIFAYAASQNNDQIKGLLLDTMNELVSSANTEFFHVYKGAGPDDVSADDLQLKYDSTYYEDYVKKMKVWADKGFWSKTAVSNSTSPRDAFENGTSASLVWNIGTLAVTQQTVEKKNPEWKPEIYDITTGKTLMLAKYTSDGMAVPAQSKHQERAFMALDKFKYDEEYNNLFRLGIKGKHWNPVGDDQWEPGPDQEKYRFGSSGTWGLKGAHERTAVTQPPIVKVISDERKTRAARPVFLNLRLDDSDITNEMATVSNVKIKYAPLLELGLVKDVDSWLAEFRAELKKAGLEKISEAVKSQFSEYLDTLKQK